MLNELIDLAHTGGRIAKDHLPEPGGMSTLRVQTKRPRDYVSQVDQQVEAAIITRISGRFPEHRILGEESGGTPDPHRPLWIIDPIDGTTNFLHGLPGFAVSIAVAEPRGGALAVRWACVFDPMRDETFTAELGGGLWLNGKRVTTSGCADLGSALLATAMPFRFPEVLDEANRVFLDVQRSCDDQRRSGSAALDLAWTAVGRLDGYYELGIYPWDTAAGELLVQCGGGAASDFRGAAGGIIGRRSIVAGASPVLHGALLAKVAPLVPLLDRPEFAPT